MIDDPQRASVRLMECVNRLASDHWRRVGDRIPSCRAAFGKPPIDQVESMISSAGLRGMHGEVTKMLQAAARKAIPDDDKDFRREIDSSLIDLASAVVGNRILARPWVRALCSPWAEVLPNEWEDQTRSMLVVPRAVCLRFAFRFQMLTGPDLKTIATLADWVVRALSLEQAQSLREEVILQLQGLEDGTIKQDIVDSFSVIDRFFDSDEYDVDSKEMMRLMRKLSGSEEWIDFYQQKYAHTNKFLRAYAHDGCIALAARRVISDQHFAMLYLPFAALISPESMVV